MGSPTQKEWLSSEFGTLELCWSEHSIGEQACQRVKVKVKLPRSFRPLTLLQNAHDWAFAWRGRDDGFLTLALDALVVISEAERMKIGRDSTLQWFGGQTFYGEGAAEWGDLRHGLWFLPAITWKLADDQAILIIQSLATARDTRQEMRQRLLSLLGDRIQADPRTPVPAVPKWTERIDHPDRAGWRRMLEAAKKGFRDGHFSKVVLSRSSYLRLDRSQTWLFWLQRLLEYQEESYIFALKSPDGHCFLGRSPERLLAWNDGAFQVDAIAGTRSRGASRDSDQSASKELLLSHKDLLEHRFVSHYIAKLLKNLQLSVEKIDDEKLLQLTHVQHLRTRFQGKLAPHCDAFELLKYLHPTPAVGGLPTVEAMDFIRQHEGTERGWYAGYIGWCSQASGECAIGIRSALVYRDTIQIFAGAGIVADSDVDAEWDETEMKMQNFLRCVDGTAVPRDVAHRDSTEAAIQR